MQQVSKKPDHEPLKKKKKCAKRNKKTVIFLNRYEIQSSKHRETFSNAGYSATMKKANFSFKFCQSLPILYTEVSTTYLIFSSN